MKKTIFLSSIFLLSISVCSFSQKKHHPNHSHNYYTHNHNNFAGGFFAGLFFSEVFGLNSNSYRQMYFKYKPGQQTWRLARDAKKRGTGFYKRGKVVAKFENPRGGRDFIVTVNRKGEWVLDCPKKFRKIFKNKVRRNL
jgi:hypothetical protein|tara:strand:- start:740 stop:1156 length:417 start_codon:yes stop_codon:yes gene_type:complete